MAKRTSWRVCVLSLGIFSLVSGLAADTVTVNAVSSGGLWSNPNTWSPAVVPNNSSGTTYAVDIGPTAYPFSNVAVDISPTVNSVSTTAANLEVLGGSTLTAGAVSSYPLGVITVDKGAALDANTVAINNVAAISSSSVQINGTASIGSLIMGPLGGLSVGSGGLANVGSVSPFGSGGNISVAGTLNIAESPGPAVTFFNLSVVGGAVTLGSGNLHLLASPNTLVNNGAYAPGPGTVLIGNFSSPCSAGLCMGSNATYDEVIDSSTIYGDLQVFSAFSGPTLQLGGTLQITLADSYVPPVGQSFVIMSSPSSVNFILDLSGAFANIEGQTFNNGKERWDVDYINTYDSGAAVLLVAAPNVVPEPSLLVLTGFGLVGIVGWSLNRRRSVPKAPAPIRLLS
jgi:hypothetical protein